MEAPKKIWVTEVEAQHYGEPAIISPHKEVPYIQADLANQETKKPMTDDDCANLIIQDYRMDEYFDAAVELIRKVEKHHGITEEK